MTFNLAPAWAASAMGIHVTGDADLPNGIHFRLAYSPILGFPLHPVPVYRSFASSLRHIDIDWFDSRNHALGAGPLTVTLDNPITGYIRLAPDTERGLWLRIDTAAGSRLVVEILAKSNVVASRNSPPYSFGGSHISAVRIRGTGTVTAWSVANRWSMEHEREPIQLLGLPAPANAIAPFYIGAPDADSRAEKRVLEGIPRRFGRHEEFLGLPGPLTDNDELDRIRTLNRRFQPLISRAIDPPIDVPPAAVKYRESDGTNRFDVNPFSQLATSSVDPVVARWLGFMGTDNPPVSDPERQSYVAFMVWAVHKSAGWQGLTRFVRALERLVPPVDPLNPEKDRATATVLRALASNHTDGALHDRLRNLPDGWEWRSLTLPFVVARDVPPNVHSPQFVGTPRTIGWTPGTFGTTATFGAEIPLQPQPTSAFALTRLGATSTALNTVLAVPGARLSKRATVIVTGKSLNVPTPVLIDRQIPAAEAGHAKWQLAEMDAFGRWSNWVSASIPNIDRPVPPAPALQVRYTQPAANGVGTLAGLFDIQVEVPNDTGLSPGGQPVHQIEFTTSWGNSTHNVTPGNVETIELTGPALQPAESMKVTLSAVFIDVDGRRSPSSTPVGRSIADPRPPVVVTIPRTLILTGRRDANGLAHAELTWPNQQGQAGYRVFYASESALRAALTRPGLTPAEQQRATALLAALASATTRADRAGLLVDQKDLYPRKSFELLTPEPLTTPHYVHALSGSLTDVAFYRIVSVGSQSVESNFTTSALAAVGVPNDRRPAPPVLNALENKAGVSIVIAPGPELAAEYRIRRTRIGLTDPRSLRIVATGSVPAPATPGLPQIVEWIDDIQPDFVRVTYVAEVRYAREFGTDRDREWSSPSNPVTWVSLPPNAPAPIASEKIKVARVGIVAIIRIAGIHPPDWDRIAPTHLEVYRRFTNGALDLLTNQTLSPGSPADEVLVIDPKTTDIQEYHFVLIDPLNRASPSTVVPLN